MTASGTLSLSDIAALAQVQRPVVSMWRARPRARGVEMPFPAPVATVGRTERFDRDEIVAWLEATGRGNNDQARLDAPALAAPDGADVEDLVSLICLSELSGEELAGLTEVNLVTLAERVDPEDRLLLREVRDLAAAPDLADYVDALVAASYGPADAIARVEDGRPGRESADRGVSPELVSLVQTVVTAARMHLAQDQVVLVPTGDAPLVLPLIEGFTGIRVDDDDPQSRAVRRRAAIRDVDVQVGSGSAVHLLALLGRSDADALEAIDRLVLDLGPSDVGVVVGPASLLCDALSGEADQRRAGTLRDGKLAIAVRLPRGLWREAHRQPLAIWVLRGGDGAQRLRVADLDGEGLALDDLASDVAAALAHSDERAYRYARSVELARVLARGPVVPRGARAVRLSTSAPTTNLDRVQTASLTTSEAIAGYDVTVAPGPGQVVVRHRSLRDLELANLLVMRPGRRIDLAAAIPTGTVRVLSADGRTDGMRLDPFDAARTYRRATRTEPGDVVFLDRPRPTAVVDTEGGALVSSPSRILRLRPGATIGPHALAALINELAPAGTDWPTWNVPDLQADAAQALDAALAAAAEHLRALRTHEHAMQDLTRNLIDGVAAGAITIDTTTRKAG